MNIRAELILAPDFLSLYVYDADISHDIESLYHVAFGIHIDFHQCMRAVYLIVFTYHLIIII